MLHPLFRLSSYLRFLTRSKGAHSLHSPFIFKLYTEAIKGTDSHPNFAKIEQLRRESSRLTRIDSGAAGADTGSRRLGEIVKTSAVPQHYGQLLYRLANYLRSETILELGTSTGFSTMYLASSSHVKKLVSIEASKERSGLAAQHLQKLNLRVPQLYTGLFEEVLPKVLPELGKPDLVLIDGDHRSEALLRNFGAILPNVHNDSVMIIDDIHWNADMEKAWEEIKQMPEVRVTADLYRLGLVFFRKEQAKEHFRLRFPLI